MPFVTSSFLLLGLLVMFPGFCRVVIWLTQAFLVLTQKVLLRCSFFQSTKPTLKMQAYNAADQSLSSPSLETTHDLHRSSSSSVGS